MFGRILAGLATACLVLGSVAHADDKGCPAKEVVLERLQSVRPERGSRTVEFKSPPPTDLYEKAAAKQGQPFAAKDGKTVWGVVVTDQPIEAIWKALNDEPHHAIEGDYIPVKHSEVIGGTPRGESRVLFQYFKKAGVGRWWVSRVQMNDQLFSDSQGKIWELTWRDGLEDVDATQPPMNTVSEDMRALESSYGAWFAVPIGDQCTLLEYYNHTEPGGFISVAQGLLAKKSVRDTLDGIVRLAEEHLPAPHPDCIFIRPDGSILD
jgi:hypothetical protein